MWYLLPSTTNAFHFIWYGPFNVIISYYKIYIVFVSRFYGWVFSFLSFFSEDDYLWRQIYSFAESVDFFVQWYAYNFLCFFFFFWLIVLHRAVFCPVICLWFSMGFFCVCVFFHGAVFCLACVICLAFSCKWYLSLMLHNVFYNCSISVTQVTGVCAISVKSGQQPVAVGFVVVAVFVLSYHHSNIFQTVQVSYFKVTVMWCHA